MNEKYGVEVLSGAIKAVGECVSVAYAVFVEKKGLWQLIGLQGPAKVLASLDLAKVKAELADCSEAEREALEADFKAALPAALAAKLNPGVDLLEKAVDLVEDGVDFVKKAIADGKALYEEVKALLGV